MRVNRAPNFAPANGMQTDKQLQSPPTIHDAKLATFTNSQAELNLQQNDYHVTSTSFDKQQQPHNHVFSYIDTSVNNQMTSVQNRNMFNRSTSSQAQSTSPMNRSRQRTYKLPESAQDYQTDQIRARFVNTNSVMTGLNASYISSNMGGSRSPTNNMSTHLEQIIGTEVNISSCDNLKATDQKASAHRIILDATKRDGELSSDGRRTVANIMNLTENLTEKVGQEEKESADRGYTNISDLSNTVS